jgi:hypothetical protein
MRRHHSGGSSGQGLGRGRAPGQVQDDLVEGGRRRPMSWTPIPASCRVRATSVRAEIRSATGGTRPWATTSVRSPLMALETGRRVVDDVAAVGSGREMLLPQWRQGPKPP